MDQRKQEIAAGYDAITEKIGLDTAFYDRCINMVHSCRGSVLDIGCGRGLLLKALRSKFPNASYTGLDISERLCAISRENNPNAHIVCGDAEMLPFASDSFDTIFMTETLEHMLDYDKAVSELVRVLKVGGFCVVTVPNRDWASYDFYDNIRDKSLQPIDDHYFRVREVQELLERHGLRITRIRGSDNLFYYGWKHSLEQIAAMFLPFLHKKMKRLIILSEKRA